MSSPLSDDTRYVKLLLLLMKGGIYVCKKHTHKILISNKTSIDVLLSNHRNKIRNDFRKKIINQRQWEMLCPDSGQTVDMNCWDISSLAYVLLNLTDGELKGNDKIAIGSIRDMRNDLAHSPVSSLPETDFLGKWSHLIKVLNQLTRGLTSEEELYIDDLIDYISKILNLDKATTELKQFENSDDFVKHVFADKFRSQQKQLDDLLQRVAELEKRQHRTESEQLEITARVTVSASTQTALDAAHHQLLESVKSCVPRGHDKQHNDEVFTACNNLFTSMSKDDISLQQVEEGSVLITFRCLTWTGLKNAILYLTKPLWIGELENVLSRSVNSCVKLNVNIVLETLISTLDSAEQCTNEKSVVLTLNCKGSKGVRNAVSYLINGSSTNTVNNISEALSRSVGERIELHTTIDVDKLEKEMKKMKHLYGYQDDMRSLTLSSFAKENIVKINNMTICLVKGDIAQQKVDVMVNTTNKSLDLKVGSVSGAILEFGQQDIQHEAYAKYREGITDDIAQTKGHKLNCQMVLHLALAKWVESKYSNDEKVMTLCDKVSKCLDVAKRSRYASIAFPAVGCGHLGYPSDLVARLMLDRFHRHAEDETVKDVRIVIHELDKKTFREFEKEFESWNYGGAKAKCKIMAEKKYSDKKGPQPESTRQQVIGQTVKVGNVRVTVVAGDIAKQRANVIVNITNTEANLSRGFASRSLLNVGGTEIQKDLSATYPFGMTYGEIAVTCGRQLTCDLLLHGCLDRWQGDNPKGSSDSLHNLIHQCLVIADEYNCPKIAFPVIGTGYLGYPRLKVAEDMFHAINFFEATNVKEVKIVVYPKDLNSVKAFQTEVGQWQSDLSVNERPSLSRREKFGYVGNIRTYIIRGNIASEKVDMIVNITTNTLDLHIGGRVAISLLNAADSGLTKELDQLYPNGIGENELAITNGHGLKCKHVIHGYLTRWHLNEPHKNVKALKNFMRNCLRVAEKYRCESIAFPTIGIGYLGYPVNIVAMEMMKSVKECSLEHVKEVRFVVYPKAHRVIQVFEEELAKSLSKKGENKDCTIS